jgi:hypothetical protein
MLPSEGMLTIDIEPADIRTQERKTEGEGGGRDLCLFYSPSTVAVTDCWG